MSERSLPSRREPSLDTPEMRERLRTLGMRRSRSAEDARAKELEAIRAMTAAERMALALRLGRRDRAMRARNEPRG